MPHIWEGTQSEEMVLQDIRQPNGEDYLYKDRRQEIVFIGHRMKRDDIQNLFDQCLLTDEEMAMGPDQWKELWGDVIPLELEEEEEEDDEDEEEDDKDDSEKKFELGDENCGKVCPAQTGGNCPELEARQGS